TQTLVRSYEPITKTKSSIITGLPRHTYCQFLDHLNEVYMAGMSESTGERIAIRNIRYDGTSTTVSTTRNLFTAPKARFIGENSGKLYAINVEIDGKIYPDRAYESSPAMGAITYVKGAQDNNQTDRELVNQVPVMTSLTAPSGTAAASTTQGANAA